MEDLFPHDRTPEDYAHMQGQVSPLAAALLETCRPMQRTMAALTPTNYQRRGMTPFAPHGR